MVPFRESAMEKYIDRCCYGFKAWRQLEAGPTSFLKNLPGSGREGEKADPACSDPQEGKSRCWLISIFTFNLRFRLAGQLSLTIM